MWPQTPLRQLDCSEPEPGSGSFSSWADVKRDDGKGLGSDKRDAGGAKGKPTDGRVQLASTQEDNAAGALVDLMEGTL